MVLHHTQIMVLHHTQIIRPHIYAIEWNICRYRSWLVHVPLISQKYDRTGPLTLAIM